MEFNSSIEGMIHAREQMESSAQRMTQNPLTKPEQDITNELLEQREAKYSFTANARVARVQNEMLGEVIDLVG